MLAKPEEDSLGLKLKNYYGKSHFRGGDIA
jgi:hypothetical protein